jgi:hypothetical protein
MAAWIAMVVDGKVGALLAASTFTWRDLGLLGPALVIAVATSLRFRRRLLVRGRRRDS